MFETAGFIFMSLGWLILIYAGWRNQRDAKRSDLVDDTNFGARVASIVEVILHPDHAAQWYKPVNGELVKVFPKLGMDSSEAHGIRPDDGKVT